MSGTDRLVDLLLLAEDWRRQGRAFTVEDLAPVEPQLWPTLRQRLADLDCLDRLLRAAAAWGSSTGPGSRASAGWWR
jgi:hypothetical protein